ncbi:AAA family ATPase [Streptomyces sp. NPDC102381]|uniref:AAA family ATPase n=1 Tax=Streptomyces sp. NPDC102381 TaxID=3366164 RepID=UPI0038156515
MTDTAPTSDHYLGLAGARPMPTAATLTTQRLLDTATKHHAMVCIHGDVGLGKTFAVRVNLRDHDSEGVLWLEFRRGAGVPALCDALFRALRVDGDPPTRPRDYDSLLLEALAARPYLLVCDEAQGLAVNALEYLRQLWNNDRTQIGIAFIGGENTKQRINSRPALSSRILSWQQYQPLTTEEVETIIPNYHPLWKDLPPEDLHWVDAAICHGNFRNWAKVTFHLQEVLESPRAPDRVDRDLVRSILSDLDTTYRS